MTLLVVFVAAVLTGAAGAIFGIGWLAALGLAAAVLCGLAVLWQLAASRPAPGSDLPLRKCPNQACGQESGADAAYCPRCGHRLAAPP